MFFHHRAIGSRRRRDVRCSERSAFLSRSPSFRPPFLGTRSDLSRRAASGLGDPNPHSHEQSGFSRSMCSTRPGCTRPMRLKSSSMCPQCRFTTCGSYVVPARPLARRAHVLPQFRHAVVLPAGERGSHVRVKVEVLPPGPEPAERSFAPEIINLDDACIRQGSKRHPRILRGEPAR